MHLHTDTLLQGGKYKIVRFISSGGFGCTYEAVHVMLDKRVAIKEFFVKDFCNRDETTAHVTVGTLSKKGLVTKLKHKFVDEAKALCHLEHKGIVRVSDVFEENGTAYFVMDYIDGCSLGDIIKKQGTLPEAKALKYIHQVCDALRVVHDHNRLHLDIKPANIMIDHNDNAVLIDFGASKQYDEVEGENTSTLMGKTPGYAPIEQLGNDVVKFMPATDIYALGATLYKVLCGITPISANLMASGDTLEPLPANISAATDKAIHEAMRLNKKMRPQSITDFLKILDSEKESEEEEDNTILDQPTTPESEIIHTTEEPVAQEKKENKGTSKKKMNILLILVCLLGGVAAFFIAKPTFNSSTATEVTDMSYTNSLGTTFTYTGEVDENGIPNGEGRGVYNNGVYEGYYVDGLRQGAAIYDTSDNTNHFEGTFDNDVYSTGKLTFTNDGSYFEGTFNGDGLYDGTYYDNTDKTTWTVKKGEYLAD